MCKEWKITQASRGIYVRNVDIPFGTRAHLRDKKAFVPQMYVNNVGIRKR